MSESSSSSSPSSPPNAEASLRTVPASMVLTQQSLQSQAQNQGQSQKQQQLSSQLLQMDATNGYLTSILNMLKFISSISSSDFTDFENDCEGSTHNDWIDDEPSFNLGLDDDDESLIDDSDDESLRNKMCTFTLTQKEFVNQHWYHCHTCNMIDRVGVCTVCAKVCHKDHDLSYAKFGAFFCDCASRENNSCMALVKRVAASATGGLSSDLFTELGNSELQNRECKTDLILLDSSDENSPRDKINDFKKKDNFQQKFAKYLEPYRDDLLNVLIQSNICKTIMDLISELIPAYVKFVTERSHAGRSKLHKDGSLRIHRVAHDLNDLCLKLSPIHNLTANFGPFPAPGSSRKKRISSKSNRKPGNSGSNPTFPVDYFENLAVLTEIDFAGNDVLSIYGVQQLKSRLNTSGMYVTCTKATGFSIDVINNDSNMVVCGVRIQVGVHDLSKSPTSIELFGRTIPISPVSSRWYDLPLTREESLQAEKKFTISFGPSPDPNNITTVDSIKVYGKSKESFHWPDDGEEQEESAVIIGGDLMGALMGKDLGARFQKLLLTSLEVFKRILDLEQGHAIDSSELNKLAKELSASLLTVPYPVQILKAIKSLSMTIHKTRHNYQQHIDQTALDFITKSLTTLKREQIDNELFSRIVYIMKSLCQSKLSNLSKLSDSLSEFLDEQSSEQTSTSESSKLEQLVVFLHGLFRYLQSARPQNESISCENSIQPFIELMYIAMLYDLSISNVVTEVFIGLLLNEDLSISTCARDTLIRLLKLRCDRSEENNADASQTNRIISEAMTTTNQKSSRDDGLVYENQISSGTAERYEPIAEQVHSLVGSQQSSIASQLRNVLRDQIESVRQDNDDDIAIAIALSLQDDSQNNSVTDNAVTAAPTTSGPSELNFLSDRMPSAEELLSDTTASGVASDEEVSASGPKTGSVQAKATDSLLADCHPSASTMNLGVGPSSALDTQTCLANQKPDAFQSKTRDQIKQQHLKLLEKLIEHLPETRDAGGHRTVSLLHVVLVLTLDLDYDNEADSTIFKNLLRVMRDELQNNTQDVASIVKRTSSNEVKLVMMKMFSILMSKVRTSSIATTVACSTRAETSSCWATFCSKITASSLVETDVPDFCYQVLEHLTEYWRKSAVYQGSSGVGPTTNNEILQPSSKRYLPKGNSQYQSPDPSPFFLRSHAKGQTDFFEDYPHLLTEVVLRIPYQIMKVTHSTSNNLRPASFSAEWSTILCEFLMIPIPSYIKKHVRKLLTSICGSKEKYRQLRDFHFLESHMKSIKKICGISNEDPSLDRNIETDNRSIILNYESMSVIIEHLKACIDIAQNRCVNWQLYCLFKDRSLLHTLVNLSLNIGEDLSQTVIELLQHALNSPHLQKNQAIFSLTSIPLITPSASEIIADQNISDCSTSESLNTNLAQQLITCLSKELISRFVQTFLLETNLTSLRWQAHNLLYNLWLNFEPKQQQDLLLVLWSLWHNLPRYGRKASQFVDLIGFFTLKISSKTEPNYYKVFCEETLNVLRQQNILLMNHPNAHIYSSIQGLVDLDNYYLESEPCSVCNCPEVAYNNVKLSSVKVDSRFTTTTQIIKLVGSHTILKFSLRISDIKRSKMVKTITIFYNNRSVQSVVELKNKTGIWSLARKHTLSPGQTDVKIEFTLPIVACNLMIEFTDFYENFQASSETLQCPRCSTSVPANPGVCSNCGENVFQCHKCRAINYDEKDPFLCISCGFCKYARFEISLTAKPTCAVDPIENEEDRKKTVASISNLLEKADRVYKNLMQNKPTLELFLLRIHEQVLPDRQCDEIYMRQDQISPQQNPPPSASSNLQAQSIVAGYVSNPSSTLIAPSVNKAIQHLAQKYCVECKGLFEELSKITHRVIASRKELVEYDNRQLRRPWNLNSSAASSAARRKSRVYSSLTSGSGRCYGCATASIEHCVIMLKALATISELRTQICDSGIINELVNFNLRSGSHNLAREVRQLLCALTRGDLNSTMALTDLLLNKIESISKHDYQPFEISNIIKHEIALLAVTLDSDDSCWEVRVRCLIKVFAFALELDNPTVKECLIIPCLRLILSIVRPTISTTRRHKDKSLESIASVRTDGYSRHVILHDWLNNCEFVFERWRQQATRPVTMNQQSNPLKPVHSNRKNVLRNQQRLDFLTEKYANKWLIKSGKFNPVLQKITSLPTNWLKSLLFNRSSKTVRLMTKSLVESLFVVQSKRPDIIDLLTGYLDEIGPASECAYEFYVLYKNLILSDHWRYYLALRGILIKLSELITLEIDNLQELEETTLTSSLSLGYSLKMLLELFTAFISDSKIRSHYKSKLVGFILKGYLSLRKLVVQRTKVIDEAQEMLLELLEGMTTGSESETASFIDVCVDAIRNCHEGDIRTPVFIFERLCSTIHPEENANSEFFVSLEKDPQQEDYLQGRMLGNPYSSNDAGIGPLMKDIKNKICQDCELVALLEDDSSMELLVSNKIICLDLPVRDVYKRIWCTENHESEAMRIVYRMRGLLGDATEEFIESLDSRNSEEVDEEQVYRMANNLGPSGGLEIMLDRLKSIDDLSPPYKPLLDVVLKLFAQCTKTEKNRLQLISIEFKTVEILLNTLRLALNEKDFLDAASLPEGIHEQTPSSMTQSNRTPTNPNPSPRTIVVDSLLTNIETILREASRQPKTTFVKFCTEACGSIDEINFLQNTAQVLSSRLPNVSHRIIQVLPFLTLGIEERMRILIDHYKPSIDFKKFDADNSASIDSAFDLFCILVDSIEENENGNQLKDFIISEGIVAKSIEYLTSYAPPLKSSLLATSEEWKEFTTRPALKYVLRILRGLSQHHAATQLLISKDCIPIIHGLEQVSSDAHVGTLAENLLEAIKEHPAVAEKIELVRRQTREEKKRLAMAVREKQLVILGMKANERGQVIAESKLLEQCQDLVEDTGLICNICREGYKFQPTKVLGIYTYTKRCVLDEFEMKPRKSYGYTTVTHFNTVHVECHMSAVRSARSRDEWDSAALQNANTRCNGLLPIWGPQVPESAYASALARHNSYLQDSTGYRDINYHSTVHDIRLQLLRFAQERSFSEDTGGGGPQSNLHLIPYMMQTALYMLNSTKAATREYKRALNFLEMGSNEVLENCYDVDGPYYWCSLALMVMPPIWWKKKRIQFLQRLIVCNHVRRVSIKPPAPVSDTRVRAYSYYKSALIFFAFIDSFYNIVFKDASNDDKWNQDWPAALADYLKHNEQTINDNIEVLLNLYQNSLLSCTTLERYLEIVRLDEITQASDFIVKTLESV